MAMNIFMHVKYKAQNLSQKSKEKKRQILGIEILNVEQDLILMTIMRESHSKRS